MELLIRSTKVKGDAKIALISSITTPTMVGIVGRAPAVDEKMCFFVTLSNDEVCECDYGNAMKQCNFQNNYGVIA